MSDGALGPCRATHTPSAQEGLKRMWDCKQRCGRKDTESAGRYRNKKGGGGGSLEAIRVRRVDVNCIDRRKSVEG